MLSLFVLFLMLLLTLILLLVTFSAFLGFIVTRVPFVSTYASDVAFFVNQLGISSRDVFYDLGSGTGKVVFLVNRLSGANCVGFELAWWAFALSALKSKFQNQTAKLQFKNQNFFRHSWSRANYIYAYLFPPLMAKVEEKFRQDCRPGTIAIIRDFPFPRLQPKEVFNLPKGHRIYIYQVAG